MGVSEKPIHLKDVDKTWSLPFETWQVSVFLAHIGQATVAASPKCRQKTQMSHVSKGSDHVLSLSYLKNTFLDPKM